MWRICRTDHRSYTFRFYQKFGVVKCAPTENLQVVAVANFKGGGAKPTIAVYLAQYMALRGYRVLDGLGTGGHVGGYAWPGERLESDDLCRAA
jgi:hypothetical protein